jgi:hypothetical protein
MERPQMRLREVGVQFDLVHGRDDTRRVDGAGEHRLGEVRDADRSDAALLLQLDHGAEGVDVLVDARVGPVDQVQVDPVEPATPRRADVPTLVREAVRLAMPAAKQASRRH